MAREQRNLPAPRSAAPILLLDGRRLAPWQSRIGWSAGFLFLLGFLASIDVFLLPRGLPHLAWLLHPLIFAGGVAGGIAAQARGAEIDRKRWEIVEDPLLTRGEREYAHKEAERQRRVAATIFMVTPLVCGYWMAYQFAAPEGGSLVGTLLGATPLPGFGIGLLVGDRILRRNAPVL